MAKWLAGVGLNHQIAACRLDSLTGWQSARHENWTNPELFQRNPIEPSFTKTIHKQLYTRRSAIGR